MSLQLKIPSGQFLEELCVWINERVTVPADGKWHEMTLQFEIKADDGGIDPPIQNFLLGGPSAG